MQFALYSKSKHVTQDQVQAIATASVLFNNGQFCPAWGIGPIAVIVVQDLSHVPQGYVAAGLVDTEAEASALGWHDEKNGLPFVMDQVTAVLDGGGGILDGGKAHVSLASVVGHEFDETLIDPFVNGWTLMPSGLFLANETGDPVQASMLPVTLSDGRTVWVNNAVKPKYFDAQGPHLTKASASSSKLYDFLGLVTRPFQNKGYQIVYDPSKVGDPDGPISDVWGDHAALAAGASPDDVTTILPATKTLLSELKLRQRSRSRRRLGR